MNNNDIPPYFRYWGKAKPKSGTQGSQYHLLPYHSLDVAAVGWFLLEPDKPLSKRLAKQLGVDPEWLQSWFVFCLMLHDLGKFARAFQNLAPNLSSELVPYVGRCIYQERHDTLGFLLWKKHLSKNLNPLFTARQLLASESWFEVVCGHHGQPPRKSLLGFESHFLAEDEVAAEEFVEGVVRSWLPSDLAYLEQIDNKALCRVSWQLAGLAVLCDWLGSDSEIFTYCSDVVSLETYWDSHALRKASEAIQKLEWEEKSVSQFQTAQQLFSFIENPTPLQSYAERAVVDEGANLFLLEDVTGAGKTEAAAILAHRLMAQGCAKGLYIALPTMATANAMYERLSKFYRMLFQGGQRPSLILAHGASKYSDAFMESVVIHEQPADKSYQVGKDAERSASAYCNAWLADNRKKALLADVGVGTIDQVLLGVLPARHQSLRLFGLNDKVLIVDEVHAYDPYMRRLLTALLEAHAVQGGSAILLSATLPQNFRQELLNGFARGLFRSAPFLEKTLAYPLATHLSSRVFEEVPIATRDCVKRSVVVARIDDEEQAVNLIEKAVADNQCICWIRNTVKDARSAFELISQQPWMGVGNITLFHSRFAMVDRQRIEGEALSKFGKYSDQGMRAGQVLIATQVVEQSLDLDFDQMISDIAPVDLLIQRAGRLQRHGRNRNGDILTDEYSNDQRDQPCLVVLAPDPDQVADENWLRGLLPGTQAVYPNVGELWLTAKVLFEQAGFDMPRDARKLVEGVYGKNAIENVPGEIMAAELRSQGEQKGMQAMGELNRLLLEKGYTRNSAKRSGGWEEEVQVPTRLGNDSVTIALAHVIGGELIAYAETEKHWWPMSQLSIPKREWQAVQGQVSASWQAKIEQLKERTPELRWVEVLPLVEEAAEYYSSDSGWNYQLER